MLIRLESSLAGDNFAYQVGDVVDWPNEEEAKRFIKRGMATQLAAGEAEKVAASSGRPVHRHATPEKATKVA